jgi:hypothetical protein
MTLKLFFLRFLVAISLLLLSFTLKMNTPPILSTNQLTTNIALLSDPFLQLPTTNSVRVIWFTNFLGTSHTVIYGENLEHKVEAVTSKLSRTREDQDSQLEDKYTQPTLRNIWRHEAIATGLNPNQRLPYQVISQQNKQKISSKIFTLAATPQPGKALKILLTSDHQLMPMTAANLQKVVETVGKVDAIFFAGDLVNISDRTSEWFDDQRGGAFFPCLQGRANYKLEKAGVTTTYRGGELIQHAPLFPAIGNHEVMGRFSDNKSLKEQFGDAIPRMQAEKSYQKIASQINPTSNPEIQETWLKDNSFNTDTYEEIFTLPPSNGGKKYYAVTFGDIRLIVLYVTNIWRSPNLKTNIKGRYQESQADINQPENWGYGQHIFEPITKDSLQYNWLEKELQSEAFQQAKYKIVMFHHPPHSLGGNIVPPYTDPQQRIKYATDGSIQTIYYDYPPKKDYIIRDLIPLLETAKVQFVFYGHSHLWNRFISSSGINFLESSNVGNTYGAHWNDNYRPIPKDTSPFTYSQLGDPNGLEPITPTIAPLLDDLNNPLPYLASNDITVFSILDTSNGKISSYCFDTSQPQSPVIKFDEFTILYKF